MADRTLASPWIALIIGLVTLVFILTASSILLFEILEMNPDHLIHSLDEILFKKVARSIRDVPD